MAQHYDVAVIGGEVSHLIAALILARAGRRVVLVGHDMPGPNPPEPCYALGDVSCVARWHDDLGIAPPNTLKKRPKVPLQIILAQHRLTINGGRAALGAELKRAFKSDAGAIDDFLQRLSQDDRALSHYLLRAPSLPPESLAQRFKAWQVGRNLKAWRQPAAGAPLDALFGSLGAGHPLRQLFVGGLQLLMDCDARAPTLFLAVHHMAQALMGQPADAVNREDLLGLLRQNVARAGIEVRQEAEVLRLCRMGKRGTHLQLAGERQQLRAEYYIYGGQKPLDGIMPQGQKDVLAARQAGAGFWLQWQWRVPRAWVNGALGPTAWLLDGRLKSRNGVPSDAPALLQHDGAADGAETTLIVTAPWYAAQDAGQMPRGPAAADVERVWQSIQPRLRRLLPYLPRYHAGLQPGYVLARPLVPVPEHSVFGLTGRTRKTPLSNVVYCGRDVVSGLGLEGEYMAAAGAAALVRQRARWP